ncbi:MAG: hypothetical protein AUI12_08715 [Acidobacteria bacterium 13_2_20CM_2_57_6]|nr:MAG: hypothetical protein AUI12_08715 [Acidobacteria bacterium 13_2_20CM_2_57_6]PYT41257.1 MAG: hypothetical protein DMG47_17810 [Acidobacteriota bacterium]
MQGREIRNPHPALAEIEEMALGAIHDLRAANFDPAPSPNIIALRLPRVPEVVLLSTIQSFPGK